MDIPIDVIATHLATIDRTTLAGKRDYALLSVALQTGRRATERALLTYGDLTIEPVHGSRPTQITIEWRHTKGGNVMYALLARKTAAVLLDWLSAFYGDRLGHLPANALLFVVLSRNSHERPSTRQALANVWQVRLGRGSWLPVKSVRSAEQCHTQLAQALSVAT